MFENPFVLSLVIALGIQAIFFVFAARFKTDKVTDLSYGLTFIALAVYWLYSDRLVTNYRLLIAMMVVFWGARISTFLLIRVLKTGRDRRFDDKRNDLVKFGRFWLLQGIAVWLIMLPTVYVLSRDEVPRMIDMISNIGLYVWSLGLVLETVADYQLYQFRFKKPKKDKPHAWIEDGLWKYSRHPNYFGEIILWWGVFLYGIPLYEGIGWLTILGPLTITGLLLFGSGIPILETANNKRWGADPAYRRYKKSTSILVPLPPKKPAAKS